MKPRLFIGSSVESLDVAYAVQEELEHSLLVTVWSQGIFDLSSNTLDTLIASLDKFDGALFVFSPDDEVKLRDATVKTVRDNVLFELGLFVGRLGRNRCFFLMPRGVDNFHLPSDIIGSSPGTYDANRPDGNLQAALGPVCNKIRRQLRDLVTDNAASPNKASSSKKEPQSPLNKDERKWLETLASRTALDEPVDIRQLQAELLNQLSRGFDPKQIDERFCLSGTRITIFGRALVDPEDEYLPFVNKVAKTVHDILIEEPKKEVITADEISSRSKVAKSLVAQILWVLAGGFAGLSKFHTSGSSYGERGLDSINIDADTFQNYIHFESIEKILEEELTRMASTNPS